MPRQRTRVPLGDFTGGLNEDVNPGSLEITDLRIARNVYWEGRALASRKGSTTLTSSALNSGAPVVGIADFRRNAGVDQDFVAVAGTKVYKSALDAAPSDITGAVSLTSHQNYLCTFETFSDVLIGVNGVDAPFKWTGSGNAAALGGSPPTAGTMVAKWNRLFLAALSSARRTIRFSDLGTHETWTASNTVRALVGDASGAVEGRDWILQLSHLGDSIFVGLANSIGRVFATGDSTTPFRYQQIAEFGVAGSWSYVPVEDHGYFLSTQGVHRVSQSDVILGLESSLISKRRLRETWNSINRARLQYSTGRLVQLAEGNLVVLWTLTSAGSTTHDMVLLMDITDGPGKERFAVWNGWDVNFLATYLNNSSLRQQLAFGTSDGFVVQGDTDTSDDGAAYTTEAATRWEDFGLPAVRKALRDIYVEASQSGSHNLTIETIFDYSTTPVQTVSYSLAGVSQSEWSSFTWNVDTWATQGFVRDYLLGLGDGVVMSWRFSTTGANQPWKILKFVPAVKGTAESKSAAA